MTISTQYAIGEIVPLFGDPNWKAVVTAIMLRADGQVEYQLEWSNEGELKAEWFTAERLACLAKIYGRENESE